MSKFEDLLGTISSFFKIGVGSTSINLKNVGGILSLRNNTDTADVGLKTFRPKTALTVSRSLTAADADTHLYYSGATPITIAVPSSLIPALSEIEIAQLGTGTITLSTDGGAIQLNGSNASIVISQNTAIVLNFYTTNSVTVFGGSPSNTVFYKTIGSTVPVSPTVGDRWLELVNNTTMSWFWDGTRWLSTNYLQFTYPSAINVGVGSDRGVSVFTIPNSSGIYFEKIGIKAWASTAHSTSSYFSVIPGYFSYNAANATTSVNFAAISTQTLTASAASFTDFSITANTAVAWNAIMYLRLQLTAGAGTPIMNYQSYFNCRCYR